MNAFLRVPLCDICALFLRNRGASAKLARDLSLTSQAVSMYLSGRTPSRRIRDAVAERAVELFALEGQTVERVVIEEPVLISRLNGIRPIAILADFAKAPPSPFVSVKLVS